MPNTWAFLVNEEEDEEDEEEEEEEDEKEDEEEDDEHLGVPHDLLGDLTVGLLHGDDGLLVPLLDAIVEQRLGVDILGRVELGRHVWNGWWQITAQGVK